MDADHGHDHEPLLPGRREALRLMAAAVALAGGACSRRPSQAIFPWVNMPETRAEGTPEFYASAVVRDGHALGVLIATYEGRPTKIEGNPLHPSSLGATDVFAQASVLQLWDPDRSQAVAQRRAGEPVLPSDWLAFQTAWREHMASARLPDGALRILTGPITSPTLGSQLEALLKQYPQARWHQYGHPSARNAREGSQSAFGSQVQPLYRFDRASCVLALAADPFSEGAGAVRHAMDWSQRRARSGPVPAFAAEVSPGLFGARADRRIARSAAEIDALVARLAAGAPAAGFEAQVLAALHAAGPGALIVPGAALSATTHARVHALLGQLGAPGNTVSYVEPLEWSAQSAGLGQLVTDMHSGGVQVLLMLDVNPVYDTPGALEFAAALARVPLGIHCGLYRNETAERCAWHLPLSHDFEQWSDARAHDGTACILQPAIAPLYDTRSLHEVVALLAGQTTDGYTRVRDLWRTRFEARFEDRWREALRAGIIEGTAAPVLNVKARALPIGAPATGEGIAHGITAHFTAGPAAHDGRFANSAWLQELPHPFTKLTWDNAALVGPSTARRFGLRSGDVVELSSGSRQVRAPVWVLPEHAEDAVTLALGYGRQRAGRVGDGVGFDAYPLMPAEDVTVPVGMRRVEGRHEFAVTQHTLDDAGRHPARTLAPGERIAPEAERPSLYPRWTYPGHAWAMTVDLDACIGCNACTIACQAENNIPVVGREQVRNGRVMHWIRVDRYRDTELGNTIFQPLPCMQCENAPCELVCPVGATMHDNEGINVQVYNRCIGTRFCSNNCPYKVRRFNFLQFSDAVSEALKGQRNPDVTVRQRGVMEKCNYCLQRVTRARQHEQRSGEPLRDGDVMTACQAVCPTRAIHFGDLNDSGSDVRQQRDSPRHYALLGELNTRPRTTYLARVRPVPGTEEQS